MYHYLPVGEPTDTTYITLSDSKICKAQLLTQCQQMWCWHPSMWIIHVRCQTSHSSKQSRIATTKTNQVQPTMLGSIRNNSHNWNNIKIKYGNKTNRVDVPSEKQKTNMAVKHPPFLRMTVWNKGFRDSNSLKCPRVFGWFLMWSK